MKWMRSATAWRWALRRATAKAAGKVSGEEICGGELFGEGDRMQPERCRCRRFADGAADFWGRPAKFAEGQAIEATR